MRRFRILVSATARRQLHEIAAWWKENRPDEPALFLDQLEASLQRLSTLPGPVARIFSNVRSMSAASCCLAARITSITRSMMTQGRCRFVLSGIRRAAMARP